ncbi:aspartate/glutamate racemase family protein (plasmid) [Parasedimentitalea marina]|uniref:Aspartate/glutamate racemase family protein n=1 Tax=Parasedimentitalea marina TaxID=2483033 RepID=A0A3T0NAG8_9RHOB|nr:aspartate/glutamate racemase family protein [Parasedimentitalea marina]AZV80979.1 aspartate/glutamate racemase family protein [Parasedimentitalea marina]
MTFDPGGQNICGISIGVLSLESYFPKPPGHIKNPSSLPFTTTYEILHGITVPKLLNNPSSDMLVPILDAARRLESQGVRAITGSCGFLALFQKEIAEAVSVPVFVSSLLQVPLAYQMTRAPVGVVTASAALLTDNHIEGVGAQGIPIVVQGLEDTEEFASVILRNERDGMDLAKVKSEVLAAGLRLIDRAPDIGAIVLECTDLPPYAHDLQAALKRPVFDLTTLATMMHDVVLRRRYSGFQ